MLLLLVGASCCAFAVFAAFAKSNLRHKVACKAVKDHGAIQCNGFEDPIGPNYLYGGCTENAPVQSNGFFPIWFVNSFCVTGFTDCDIKNLPANSRIWEQFSHLYNLRSLVISDSCFPFSWSKSLKDCHELRILHLELYSIEEKDFEHLSCLEKLKYLVLSGVHLTEDDLKSFAHLKQLENLDFVNSNVSYDDIATIKELLPNCDVGFIDQ